VEKLNKLELEIFKRMSIKYPKLIEHYSIIKIQNRKNTGVGMYVDFFYDKKFEDLNKLDIEDGSISTNENIILKNLKYGLGYEICIAAGKIKFIEFFTYGEEWNGEFIDFCFEEL
jgi:hypothetical protein